MLKIKTMFTAGFDILYVYVLFETSLTLVESNLTEKSIYTRSIGLMFEAVMHDLFYLQLYIKISESLWSVFI